MFIRDITPPMPELETTYADVVEVSSDVTNNIPTAVDIGATSATVTEPNTSPQRLIPGSCFGKVDVRKQN